MRQILVNFFFELLIQKGFEGVFTKQCFCCKNYLSKKLHTMNKSCPSRVFIRNKDHNNFHDKFVKQFCYPFQGSDPAIGVTLHPWEELLQFLFQCAQSGKAIGIETALNLIYQCPTIFGSQLEKYSDVLRNLLRECMTGTHSLEMRGLAVKCICNLITDDPDSSTARKIQALLPSLVQVVADYSVDKGCDVLQDRS
jgi:hypothetical protein